MSLWLQEQMKKVDERREQCTPKSGSIKITVIVFVMIEAALVIANQFTPDYNTLPLCGMVGMMGVVIIFIFASKSKTMPDKPKLPSAVKCIEGLHFSPEELQQFDAEMMSRPRVVINNDNRSDMPVIITDHYMAYSYFDMGELDYRIYRLSDIAMTCYASGKSQSTANPLDKTFSIDLLDQRAEKVSGLSIDGKKNFEQFNEALGKYAPHIQLNVPYNEVKKIRKNA